MRIFLRPVKESDGPSIVRWRNDPYVRSHCMDKTPITEESNTNFYKANILTGKYKQYIVECLDDITGVCSYPIATVYLKDMDHGNQRCELCIFTSSDIEWQSEGQIIAIKQLIEKAFNEFDMHKVYSYVFKKYPDEIEVLKKAGFSEEAVLKEEAKSKSGHFEDIIRFSIFKDRD